jgi:hypothetical protein
MLETKTFILYFTFTLFQWLMFMTTDNSWHLRFEVSTAVTMMIIIFWEMVLIRATRCHLPEDDNHQFLALFPYSVVSTF